MNNRITKVAAATASMIFIGSAASAVSVDYLGLKGYSNVDVATPAYDGPAGAMEVRADTGGGMEDFIAWCLDLERTIASTWDYTVKSMSDAVFSNGGVLLTDPQKTDIKRLFDSAYLGLNIDDNTEAAGFQLALWEIAYEDSGNAYDLDTGDFSELALSGAGTFANTLLGNLDDVTGNWVPFFLEAENRGAQNLVSATLDTTPDIVPVPAAGLLLISGLAGLGIAGRRRRSLKG